VITTGTATTLLFALLALRPHSPARHCIDARHDVIVAQATAVSERYGVPVAVLLVTAFNETHIGCDRGEGGGWGAPASRTRRHVAGTPDNHASALALGYRRCHTWEAAIAHYRTGLCNGVPRIGYTAQGAMRRVRQLDPGLR
jgi:hypothetical protein